MMVKAIFQDADSKIKTEEGSSSQISIDLSVSFAYKSVREGFSEVTSYLSMLVTACNNVNTERDISVQWYVEV